MAFDFKKEFKEYYQPKNKPSIINVPKMNYIAIRGKGNPNEENGDYQNTLGLLYTIAYTLKMSYKGDYRIDGFFEYVVPPLEGFWWQDNRTDIDYNHKEQLNFISLIRLPDFVTKSLVASGKLCYLDVCDMNIDIWKQLIYHKNKWLSNSMKAFLEYVKEHEFN